MNSEKKSANWITIPDENHQDNQMGVPSQNPDLVKNKLLWGIGFAVIIIVSFIVLAPNQFNALIQGNLFDAKGLSEKDMKVNLLPQKKETNVPISNSASGLADIEDQNNSDPSNINNLLIQPNSDPVTIAIDPIAPKDCGSDLDCFANTLESCTLSKASINYQIVTQSFSAQLDLNASVADKCRVEVSFIQSPDASLSGTKSTCEIPKSAGYTGEQIKNLLTDQSQFNEQCSGDLNTRLSGFLAQAKAQEEADTKEQLISDLTQKIENLNKQLANSNNGLRGAAADIGAMSNLAIGQPSAQNPAFRSNPYRVTVTPAEILQQNQSQGFVASPVGQNNFPNTISARQINGNLSSPVFQNQNLSGGKTPETGAGETLLIALFFTYIALSGWKYLRHLKSN